MNRWIVFDAMGVVFEVGDDTNELLVPFIQQRNGGVSAQLILELYRRASLGEMTSQQFWEEIGLGAGYPQVERQYLDSCLTLDPQFKGTAARLARSFKLGLLSNDVREWSEYLRAKHGLDNFAAVAISGEVGCRKPEVGIYEAFLRAANTTPDACMFVDDRSRNLETARRLGFGTIRFQRQTGADAFSPDFEVDSFPALEETVRHIW
jgi:putative hydrolase of the HAD superfamily